MKNRLIAYCTLVLLLVIVGVAYSDYCDFLDKVEASPQNGMRCGRLPDNCVARLDADQRIWKQACSGRVKACKNYRPCSYFFVEWFKYDLCGECNNTVQNELYVMVWSCTLPNGGCAPPCDFWPRLRLTVYKIVAHPTMNDCKGVPCPGMTTPPPSSTINPVAGGGTIPGATGAATTIGGRTFYLAQPPTYHAPVSYTRTELD